jgi:hypothetical protein
MLAQAIEFLSTRQTYFIQDDNIFEKEYDDILAWIVHCRFSVIV